MTIGRYLLRFRATVEVQLISSHCAVSVERNLVSVYLHVATNTTERGAYFNCYSICCWSINYSNVELVMCLLLHAVLAEVDPIPSIPFIFLSQGRKKGLACMSLRTSSIEDMHHFHTLRDNPQRAIVFVCGCVGANVRM